LLNVLLQLANKNGFKNKNKNYYRVGHYSTVEQGKGNVIPGLN
jgi:hypothetical protein